MCACWLLLFITIKTSTECPSCTYCYCLTLGCDVCVIFSIVDTLISCHMNFLCLSIMATLGFLHPAERKPKVCQPIRSVLSVLS